MVVLGKFDRQPSPRNTSVILSDTVLPLLEVCHAFSGGLSPNETRWLSAFMPEFFDLETPPSGGGDLQDNLSRSVHDLCRHIDQFAPHRSSISPYGDNRLTDIFLESLI